MLRFRIEIGWPWRAPICSTRDVFFKDWEIADNKSLEIQIATWSASPNLFELDIDTNWKGSDHAGPSLFINLWRFMFSVKIYDHRHWVHETDSWDSQI